jgi:hypothetical protein
MGTGRGRPPKEEGLSNMESVDKAQEEPDEIAILTKRVEELQNKLDLWMLNKKVKTDAKEGGSDSYVKVMSLTPHLLNLSTEGNGKGKIFTFHKFGEVKKILYRDLVDILSANQKFHEQGLFYIMNKEVIEEHGLEDMYEKVLTKESILKIINGENQTDAVNIFSSATEKQQDFVCEMFIQKIFDGENVDLNLVDRLSRVMQKRIKDYDIRKKAEEAKAYSELK